MLEKGNRDFRLVCTMTAMAQSRKEWKGETGLINRAMLSRYLTNLQEPIYYIAGPPAMVAGLRKMLVPRTLTRTTFERKILPDTEAR
jgi:NAD(P)H-flavin reductase